VQVLAPLDSLRRDALRLALARPTVAAWLRTKDRRIALVSTCGVLLALALATVLPAAMLVLTPIVLGVPHVASDARYLVVRQGVPRAWVAVVAVACASLVALRALEGLAPIDAPFGAIEVGLASIWIAAAAIHGASQARAWGRLAVALPIVGAIGALALRAPDLARVAFAHVHNLVGVAIWVIVFRRKGQGSKADEARSSMRGQERHAAGYLAAVPALVALCVAVAVSLSGMPARVAAHLGTDAALGINLGDAAQALAPGLPLGLALGVVTSYVVLQSVHYAVWLGWIPQESIRAEGTLTFRMTARSLRRDFGALGLAAIGLSWVAVVAFAFIDAKTTRDTYLSLAAFHAYLEVAMLAWLVTAGLPCRERADAS
jgi:hypothetical protein